jgi:hypothetical protein
VSNKSNYQLSPRLQSLHLVTVQTLERWINTKSRMFSALFSFHSPFSMLTANLRQLAGDHSHPTSGEMYKQKDRQKKSSPRQQATAKTPAKWPAYQIPSVILVFVILLCKSYSQRPHEALNLLFAEECYWAPYYTLFYTLFTQFPECTSTDCK